MFFRIPLVGFLAYLVYSTVVDSLVIANLPIQNIYLPQSNNSQGHNAIAVSSVSNVSALPTPLPYGFSVPSTGIYLRLGFGLPRRSLEPMSMGGLIAVMQHDILEGIERDGVEAFPGLNILAGKQRVGWTLGDGFHFTIRCINRSGRYFTWGQLQNVVEGLRLFLIVGERYYSTTFNFWDGPGWWWKKPLGVGAFTMSGAGTEGSVGKSSKLTHNAKA